MAKVTRKTYSRDVRLSRRVRALLPREYEPVMMILRKDYDTIILRKVVYDVSHRDGKITEHWRTRRELRSVLPRS